MAQLAVRRKPLPHFFYDELGVVSHLSALGIDDAHFEDMAAHATANGPIAGMTTLDKDDIMAIYRMCL